MDIIMNKVTLIIFISFNLIINVYYTESCLLRKVKVIKGELYTIGLFSIDIVENQPQIIKSDAFRRYLNLIRHVSNDNYISGNTANFSIACTAYELCDNMKFMADVTLSLILDEEYSFSYGANNEKNSRIVGILTHISASLTKLLVNLFSFENEIPIVSASKTFSNNKELTPHHFPITQVHLIPQIIMLLKVYPLKRIVVACLTNETHFNQFCNRIIDILSNDEMNSCFSYAKVYNENDLEVLVTSIASKNKDQTIIVVIGNNVHQHQFLLQMLKYKLVRRNIISYGLKIEFNQFRAYRYELIEDFKLLYLPGDETFQLRTLERSLTDQILKLVLPLNSSNENLLTMQFNYNSDLWLYHFMEFPKYTLSYKQILSFTKNSIFTYQDTTSRIDISFWRPIGIWNYKVGTTGNNGIIVGDRWYPKENLQSLRCPRALCNSSNEPIIIKRYGIEIWNNTQDWTCEQCRDNYIQPNDNTNASCVICPSFYVSNKIHTKCVDPYPAKYLSLDDNHVYIPLVIEVILVVFIMMTVVVFVKLAEAKEIKASNKTMTITQVTIFLMFFISFPAVMIGKPSDVKCFIRPMIFGYTFNIVSSIILVKSTKLLRIFNADLRFTKGEIRKSKIIEAIIIFTFIMLETVLNFLCIVRIPPKVFYALRNEERHMFCNNNQHFVIHIVVTFITFFVSIVQCFRIRKLPSVFNEAKEMLYATLMADFILALTLLLYYSRSTEYGQDFVILLMLSLMAGSFYILLFYKKILLFFRSNQIKQKRSVYTIGSFKSQNSSYT